MPEIKCYRCPHCNEIYMERVEYRKHILETMQQAAETINQLYREAAKLNILFGENFSCFSMEHYYEAKDMEDKEEEEEE